MISLSLIAVDDWPRLRRTCNRLSVVQTQQLHLRPVHRMATHAIEADPIECGDRYFVLGEGADGRLRVGAGADGPAVERERLFDVGETESFRVMGAHA